ncbi:MAG: squalene synthase HpnC [Terriglobales bacterium]
MFLPERLREHFYSVYAYCRISDDLGDEVGNPEQSLRLLDEWEAELDATYETLIISDNNSSIETDASAEPASAAEVNRKQETGNGKRGPRHPVFIALRQTIRACQIPKQPFADLLKAFRQDQTTVRYKTFDDLLGYCRYSANPVGRLVLYVCGYRDLERQRLSDFTCTALQLANFWQDVAVDYGKGRIYLPLDDMRRFGVTEQEIAQRRCSARFRDLMCFEVARARDWFVQGLPLVRRVDRELAIDIELFSRGGQEILNAIERQRYDVLTSRPEISKRRKIWLLARAALKSRLA